MSEGAIVIRRNTNPAYRSASVPAKVPEVGTGKRRYFTALGGDLADVAVAVWEPEIPATCRCAHLCAQELR